ncbi:Heat stress transcription factor B-2b [Bienertia sinuspersici]
MPADQNGESAAAGGSGSGNAGDSQQRTLPTPFLTKTYQLVDDPSFDDLISWNDDGSSFIVWRPAEFARDLLPNAAKKALLRDIQRRKISPSPVSNPTTPTAAAVTVAAAAPVPLRTVSPSNSGDEQSALIELISCTGSCNSTKSNNNKFDIIDGNRRRKREEGVNVRDCLGVSIGAKRVRRDDEEENRGSAEREGEGCDPLQTQARSTRFRGMRSQPFD